MRYMLSRCCDFHVKIWLTTVSPWSISRVHEAWPGLRKVTDAWHFSSKFSPDALLRRLLLPTSITSSACSPFIASALLLTAAGSAAEEFWACRRRALGTLRHLLPLHCILVSLRSPQPLRTCCRTASLTSRTFRFSRHTGQTAPCRQIRPRLRRWGSKPCYGLHSHVTSVLL